MGSRTPPADAAMRDELPLTVLVGDPASGCVDIYDKAAALHVTVADRHQHAAIDDGQWAATPGVYILLDRPDQANGEWGVYVGKAPAGVKTRLRAHLREKTHWYRVVLVRSDTTHGWNSAEVGWLEGRLYDLMDSAENAVLHNGNRPMDETLPVFTRNALERAVLPIGRILALLGHDPAPPDPDSSETSQGGSVSPWVGKKYFGATILQVLQGSDLQPGRLVSSNGAWPAEAELKADGTIVYDGQAYTSPSSAATAAKDGGTVNGWDFWVVPDGNRNISLATFRKQYLERVEQNGAASAPPGTD